MFEGEQLIQDTKIPAKKCLNLVLKTNEESGSKTIDDGGNGDKSTVLDLRCHSSVSSKDGGNGKQHRCDANGNHEENCLHKEADVENKIRIGPEYQAVCPPFISDRTTISSIEEKAWNIWSPSETISEATLDNYLSSAKKRHGFDEEQGLAILSFKNNNIKNAVKELDSYNVMDTQWVEADKKLFEKLLKVKPKDIGRIQKFMPHKTMKELVLHYYTRKRPQPLKRGRKN